MKFISILLAACWAALALASADVHNGFEGTARHARLARQVASSAEALIPRAKVNRRSCSAKVPQINLY